MKKVFRTKYGPVGAHKIELREQIPKSFNFALNLIFGCNFLPFHCWVHVICVKIEDPFWYFSSILVFKAWYFTCRANEKKLPIECLTTQDYSRERTTMTSSMFRRMAKYFYKTREEGFMGELFSQGWAPLVLYMVMSDGSYSWPLEGRVRCVKKKPCRNYVYLAS